MTSIEFPYFEELAFEEEKHIYKLKGKVIPSVSSIMRPLSNALYRGVDEGILNKAAMRGHIVHHAIENYVMFGVSDIEPEYSGYLDAFKQWWEDTDPTALATECRAYHKTLKYAGTADMPVLIDGERILVDFKTSASINKMLTGVQLESYAKAYESHGFSFDGKAILHLKRNGKYTWLYYSKNDVESWEVFGALLTVHNHIKRYKNK